jgi:hypothetical protein
MNADKEARGERWTIVSSARIVEGTCPCRVLLGVEVAAYRSRAKRQKKEETKLMMQLRVF